MDHLHFPFGKSGVLIFKNPGSERKDISLFAEIAESTMEIFQALSYRELKDFRYPLLLNFTAPYQQSFVMMDWNFSVQIITVGWDNVVNNIYDHKKKSHKGRFIKSFSDLKMALLTRPADDIWHTFNIQKNHTIVGLVHHI